mmetsp:Transcript_1212/g.4750  ORF Transcript_1212/g.4750 Transcript_1212/m.4750 type:complete len:92 (-) Transcript_1212:1266-1541(-)
MMHCISRQGPHETVRANLMREGVQGLPHTCLCSKRITRFQETLQVSIPSTRPSPSSGKARQGRRDPSAKASEPMGFLYPGVPMIVQQDQMR